MACSQYENIAAFSHGGFLTSALSVIFGVDIPKKKVHCGNCATLVLELKDGAWRMVGWINV